MKIYIGADHRGFELKEKIKKWLVEWGHEVSDMGAHAFDPHDDYTLYAQKVASVVGDKDKEKDKVLGVLLCGSGVGVNIVANKLDGVRAGIGKSAEQVKVAREDDDMNILVIAADFTSEEEAKEMTKSFLETKFDKEARHKRRLSDIEKIEANN